MEKSQLVKLIQDTAGVLRPLIEGKPNPIPEGVAFDIDRDWISPEPYALAWWSKLHEMATMLDYQDCQLSEKQLYHIKSVLGVYGGNGSLADLFFEARDFQAESLVVNDGLRERIALLRLAFKEEPTQSP